MALTISFNDLMTECGIAGTKEFKRFLQTARFRVSADYDKKTADLIASRLGLRIPWHKYRRQQSGEQPVEPLGRDVPHDLVDRVNRWYAQLVPSQFPAELNRDCVLGLACAGGFLEAAPGQEFLIDFAPGTNVLIGDRGSGKSTVLNLLGTLAGSVVPDTDVLVRMLLTSTDNSEHDVTSAARRLQQIMRDYDLTLFACYVRRNGADLCSIVTQGASWRHNVFARRDGEWCQVEGAEWGLDLPMQCFRQGEVTKISELEDEYFLNRLLDSVCPALNQSREQLARTLSKLKEQHFHYTRPARPFNVRNAMDFIAQRHDDLSRLETHAKDQTSRTLCLESLERWVTIFDRLTPPRTPTVVSLLTSGFDDDLYWLFLQPIIGSVRRAARAIRRLAAAGATATAVDDQVGAAQAEPAFRGAEAPSVGQAIGQLQDAASSRLRSLASLTESYGNIDVACDDSLRALARSHAQALAERAALLAAQDAECQRAAERLNGDGVDIRMYTLEYTQRVTECQAQIEALQGLDLTYNGVCEFAVGGNGELDTPALEGLSGRYRESVASLLHRLDNLSDWDVPAPSAQSFLFDQLEIDLRQGDAYRGFDRLSFGQRCGIILKLALLSDDKRVLVLDQPEDHLDAYSILRLIAPALQNVAARRQVILATHSSTLVLGIRPDRLTVLEPDGGKGRIRAQGALSDSSVARHMLDILEGREETFRVKVDLYEDALRGIGRIDEASVRLIESSFRRRGASGQARPRRYTVLVGDTKSHIDATVRALEVAAGTTGIQLDTVRATSEPEIFGSLRARAFDAVFIDYPMASAAGDPLERFDDPFRELLIVVMDKWTRQGLELLFRERRKAVTDRLRFLRKPFDSVDLAVMFADIDRDYYGRSYPFPLAYAMRSVTGATTAQGRLNALKDVVEAIVKYAVVVLMADAVRVGAWDKVGFSMTLTGHLTLGSWLTLLRDLLRYWGRNRDQLFMSELVPLFVKEDGTDNVALRKLSEFKDAVRDPVIGHGVQLDEGAYELLLTQYEDKIRDVYDRCLFMARYHLIAVEGTNVRPDEYDYEVRVLMGSDTRFTMVSLKSVHRLQRRRVYVWRRGGGVLSLEPFAILATCARCGADRFFLLNSVTKQEREIAYSSVCTHDTYTGERRTLDGVLAGT